MHLGQRYTSCGNFWVTRLFFFLSTVEYTPPVLCFQLASYISKGRLRHPVMFTQGKKENTMAEKYSWAVETHALH